MSEAMEVESNGYETEITEYDKSVKVEFEGMYPDYPFKLTVKGFKDKTQHIHLDMEMAEALIVGLEEMIS